MKLGGYTPAHFLLRVYYYRKLIILTINYSSSDLAKDSNLNAEIFKFNLKI
jgi:hypothetical protein